MVVCLLMTAFAVSPAITLGSPCSSDLSGPWSAPLAAFRSSGRFFWPLAYLALTWAVATVARRLPPWRSPSCDGRGRLVQAVDLQDATPHRRATARDPAFHEWTRPFVSPAGSTIAPHYAHLVLVPPPQCGASPVPYRAGGAFAADHGLTVNAGVIARGDDGARRRYCAALDADDRAGRLESGTVYIVDATTAQALRGGWPESRQLQRPGRHLDVCRTRWRTSIADSLTTVSARAAARRRSPQSARCRC